MRAGRSLAHAEGYHCASRALRARVAALQGTDASHCAAHAIEFSNRLPRLSDSAFGRLQRVIVSQSRRLLLCQRQHSLVLEEFGGGGGNGRLHLLGSA